MDVIHYAGVSALTGTDIAHAVLGYAQALAEVGSSETIDIPTIDDEGQPGRWEIVIGPASQLVSSAATGWTGTELTDEELVSQLDARAEELRQHGTSAPTAHPLADTSDRRGPWTDYDVI